MEVWIDADGCPVVNITVKLCRKYHIPCTILCDTAHEFRSIDAAVLVFDKGTDSVDYALVARLHKGDLVITQDYGLASMCLARGARVLHQDGWEYSEWNIDALLLERHEARKFRASGGHFKGARKRTATQDQAFGAALEKLLSAQNSVQG